MTAAAALWVFPLAAVYNSGNLLTQDSLQLLLGPGLWLSLGGPAKGRSRSVSACMFFCSLHTYEKSVCESAGRVTVEKGSQTDRSCGLSLQAPQRASWPAGLVSRGAQLRDEVPLEYLFGGSSVPTLAPSCLGLSSLR